MESSKKEALDISPRKETAEELSEVTDMSMVTPESLDISKGSASVTVTSVAEEADDVLVLRLELKFQRLRPLN